jgi:hypothetical protein
VEIQGILLIKGYNSNGKDKTLKCETDFSENAAKRFNNPAMIKYNECKNCDIKKSLLPPIYNQMQKNIKVGYVE